MIAEGAGHWPHREAAELFHESLLRVPGVAALSAGERARWECHRVRRGLVSAAQRGADDERLKAAPDGPVDVVQDGLREARAAGVQQRARVEADPLAARLAVQVDVEVGVDEQEARRTAATR